MKMKKKYKRIAKVVIVLGVLVGVFFWVLKWLFPSYEAPAGTGKYAVKTETFTWEDESRVETFTDTGENRALTVKIWYPDIDKGKYPLVVFSHGAFGIIDSNYSTCTELASKGYVVASIAHPYHAMFVEDVNGKMTFVDMDFMQQVYADNGADTAEAERKVYEFSLEWMELRAADMNFVLDTILEKAEEKEGEFAMVDTERIGLFGHSMGGATAVELGRERSDIDAVIDLEGTMAGEYMGFENGYELYDSEPYPVPLLDVNSGAVREQLEVTAAEHPKWEYVNDYVGRNALDYREVIFNDAGHLNFTDLPLFSPPLAGVLGVGEVDAEECIKNMNEMVCCFFDYYLKGEGTLENIKSEY